MAGRVESQIRALSAEQNAEIGKQIEKLMAKELQYLINKYTARYRWICYDAFGWTTEDIHQQIRIVLWRSLATFDETKSKLTTYVSIVLSHYFISLQKKCNTKKIQGTKLIFVDNPGVLDANRHNSIDITNVDPNLNQHDFIDWNQVSVRFLESLPEKERRVYQLFCDNVRSVADISRELEIEKHVALRLVKLVKKKLNLHLMDIHDEQERVIYDDIEGLSDTELSMDQA